MLISANVSCGGLDGGINPSMLMGPDGVSIAGISTEPPELRTESDEPESRL